MIFDLLGHFKIYPHEHGTEAPCPPVLTQLPLTSVDNPVPNRLERSIYSFASSATLTDFLEKQQGSSTPTLGKVDAFELTNISTPYDEIHDRKIPMKLWEDAIRRLPKATRLVRFDVSAALGGPSDCSISHFYMERFALYIAFRTKRHGGARIEFAGTPSRRYAATILQLIPKVVVWGNGRFWKRGELGELEETASMRRELGAMLPCEQCMTQGFFSSRGKTMCEIHGWD